MSAERTATLRPRLAAAQEALAAALEEACEIDVQGADIDELLRLEEQLTAARESASNVIAVLRGLPRKAAHDVEEQDAHRLYVDDRGVQWDAFVVKPTRTRGRETLPPPYDQGWLAIQCPDGVRRVTPIPEGWRECSREEFCKLLENAPVSPRRTM